MRIMLACKRVLYLVELECKFAGEGEGRALVDKRPENESQSGDQARAIDRMHLLLFSFRFFNAH